jgi:hypothetical protein
MPTCDAQRKPIRRYTVLRCKSIHRQADPQLQWPGPCADVATPTTNEIHLETTLVGSCLSSNLPPRQHPNILLQGYGPGPDARARSMKHPPDRLAIRVGSVQAPGRRGPDTGLDRSLLRSFLPPGGGGRHGIGERRPHGAPRAPRADPASRESPPAAARLHRAGGRPGPAHSTCSRRPTAARTHL